ncbi:MAG TPA: DUF3604 domain-containing protein, partial [Bryobacterales bacterium]|nr:DUF3604 domain-containing protein [Bryobacterales bacterium]
ASVAVDAQDRVWVAWDESGANWGKDWNHEDSWRGTPLYTDRAIRVAVLDHGSWKQPADLAGSIPARYRRYWQMPQLAADAAGRIWMLLQCRTSSANNRADYWANNGRWEYFYTSYEGDHWLTLTPIPESATRNQGETGAAVGPDHRVWLAWTRDNRSFGPPGRFDQPTPMMYEVWTSAVGSQDPPAAPVLEAFAEPPLPATPVHPNEVADVARIRTYRSGDLRILRGDFHRHTEISPDGAGDGSIDDYFRYMMDAARMDTGIISDHNAGNNVEYTWWRTEKAIDLYHIPGGYTPLFGYERSVNYPNGHRNIVFDHRGVRTLPVSPAENKGAINSGPLLYPYLRQNRGIAMEHSLATGQGTDWRDNAPDVEPLVEIYQGYHAAYEYEGGPRAETGHYTVNIHGGYRPLGFYWNALKKGYKLGIQSSSDHISTHSSYTMIYSPTTIRHDIVESMRERHAYGATDNIVLDFRTADGHRMGDAFEASAPPRFEVKVEGTDRILTVEIIRNGEFVFTTRPDSPNADFSYVDNNPPHGVEIWYYVRVTQIDRNLAWSSPMWVKMR